MKTNNKVVMMIVGIPIITTILSATILSSTYVSADNDSVVDQINITVPVSCTMTGTGMDSHSTEIQNGLYKDNIGTTTLHAFCNDNEGFAIYAAGYTGNEIGGTNSNKLVGTNASSNATIISGIATTASNPDISNWAMKLTMTQDSGDTTTDNAFTIDSAPNVDLPSEAEQSATPASFSEYHVVPNEYTKVAHKNSMTDMTAVSGGVKLTTTYAAYISKTQPADTYTGQVIYTLVHPASHDAPVVPEKISVNFHADGSTFPNGATENQVVYAAQPMYISTSPLIAKTSNIIDDEGTQQGSYPATSGQPTPVPITAVGAKKMKVVVRYGLSGGTTLSVVEGNYDGQSELGKHETLQGYSAGTVTHVFNGDTVTFYMMAYSDPSSADGLDYGYFAEVYPVYDAEQVDTVVSNEFTHVTLDKGNYSTPVNWGGSWYADINNRHYDFTSDIELVDFLSANSAAASGTSIDLYRGLTFDEAFAEANKTKEGGYYKQQDLTESMCNTISVTQKQTVKDVRDGNIYMVGKLKNGSCWMLNNLALDPTDSVTAASMDESNTNATAEAIANLLHGGSLNEGWGSAAVTNAQTYDFAEGGYTAPRINNTNTDKLAISFGAAATNDQAKAGIYYNYCAASASTYCYDEQSGFDAPGSYLDTSQDLCPAGWRIPTAYEMEDIISRYDTSLDAENPSSLRYSLSPILSGVHHYDSYYSGDYCWGQHSMWWTATYMYSSNSSFAVRGPAGMYSFEFFYDAYQGDNIYVEDNYRNSGVPIRCLTAD